MRVRCKFVPDTMVWFSLNDELDCREEQVNGEILYYISVIVTENDEFSVNYEGSNIVVPNPGAGVYDLKLSQPDFEMMFEVI